MRCEYEMQTKCTRVNVDGNEIYKTIMAAWLPVNLTKINISSYFWSASSWKMNVQSRDIKKKQQHIKITYIM